MQIAPDTVLVPNENCPVREVGGGLVIMAPEGTATHALEEIGAFIWRQLDGHHRLADVAGAIVAEYDVPPEQASQDLQAFVVQLMEADLVRPV